MNARTKRQNETVCQTGEVYAESRFMNSIFTIVVASVDGGVMIALITKAYCLSSCDHSPFITKTTTRISVFGPF